MGHETGGAAPPQVDDLLAFLELHPGAFGLSIGPNGISARPLPTALATKLPEYDREPGDEGLPPLELLSSEDRRAALSAFARCWRNGYAQCVITEDDPRGTHTLTMWDLRSEVGEMIAVVVPGLLADIAPTEPESPRPRLLVHTVSESGRTLTIDRATERLLGWTEDEFVGESRLDFVHPDDHEESILGWVEMLETPHASGRRRTRYRSKLDDRWIWFEVTTTNLLDRFGHVRCEMLDISDSMAAFDALHQREQLLRFITDGLPHGLVHMSVDGEILFANDQLATIAGREASPKELLSQIAPADRRRLYMAFSQAVSGRDVDIEGAITRPDGSKRWCQLKVRSLGDADAGVLLTVEDITERWEQEQELETRASTDSLTGLLNRRAILDALTDALDGSGSSSGPTTIAFLDLNGFKTVNDLHGHRTGDRVLAVLAASIRSVLRPGDLVGRLGGDEFLVVWRDTSEATAEQLARRLRAAISQEVIVDGHVIQCTTSCGLATTTTGTMTAEDMIAAADHDMYREKHQGHAPIVTPLLN